MFVVNYFDNVYPYLSLFNLFSSLYSAYIQWIHVIHILQVRKFRHQIRVALCNRLVVLKIYQIQTGSYVGQARHVGLFWSLSYW